MTHQNFSPKFLPAMTQAKTDSTAFGLSRGGWVRLARMASMSVDGKTYVIAVRQRTDTDAAELGCGCPDWVYRKRGTSLLCKHQRAFLAHQGGTSLVSGIWMYRAGNSFLRILHASEESCHPGTASCTG